MSRTALRITAVYLLFGLSWILFGGTLAQRLVQHRGTHERLEMGIGILYVLLTSCVLYAAVSRTTAERERAEKARKAIERQQSLILASLPIVLFRARPSGNHDITWISRNVEPLAGFPAERFTGEASFWVSRVHPEDRPKLTEYRRTILAAGGATVQYRWQRADGSYLWILNQASLVRDEGGSPKEITGTLQDISEAKRAEQTIQQFTTQNELILNAAGEGIYGLDLEGKVTFVNPAAAEMLACEPDDLIGTPSHPTFHHTRADGSPYPWVECPIYASFKDGTVHRMRQDIFWRMDGASFPVEYVSTPIRQDGILAGAVVVFKDITERKRSEKALRQQLTRIQMLNEIARAAAAGLDEESILRAVAERLEGALPNDLVGVASCDSRTNTFAMVATASRARPVAEEIGISGGTVFPVDGTGLEDCLQGEITHVPDLASQAAPILQRLAGAGFRSLVAVPLAAAGDVFAVLAVARHEAGGFGAREVEFLGTLADQVSLAVHQARLHHELKLAYEDIQKTQQAAMQQERLRALGQMASGVAHDINNALSPIIGYTELVLAGEPGLSERAKRYLALVKTAGLDVTGIVARMREFYRQRQEGEDLVPVNLNRLAKQVIDLTRPRWRDIPQERGVVISAETDLASGLPLVMGVEGELREALTNLVLNAVDAMPEGGTATIRTRVDRRPARRVGGGESPPTHVSLEVADTGTGMDEETRKRCLEPFFSTKGDRGTGLGLAMVYGTTRRHNGQIEIESALGKGTTVRLILPTAESSQEGSASRSEKRAPPRPLRILCIDDEASVRQLVREMLESDGHAVEVAEGGETGIEAFRAARRAGEPFDVVLSDLGMPRVDGREVARTVKRESPATPVLLLTGWGSRLGAEGDIPAEVNDVIGKPPKMQDLRRALSKVSAPSDVPGKASKPS